MVRKLLITLLSVVGFVAGADLNELIEFALENNPRIKSFDRLKKALAYRETFSRSLPNPVFSFGLNNIDTERYFPSKKNPMSGFGLFLSQKYVLPVKREKSAQILVGRQREIDRIRERFEKELIKKIKVLYWDFSYSFELRRILKGIENEIRALLDITEERYRYGEALLSDLILLKVELMKVEEKLSEA
ncbi:MAG TPA: hypothetical protein EYH49_00850, partial [Aquifex aeolicus]|nr:hypothetical protein [Aquifex aeolicus]